MNSEQRIYYGGMLYAIVITILMSYQAYDIAAGLAFYGLMLGLAEIARRQK